MPRLRPGTAAGSELKQPSDFSRFSFRVAVHDAHQAAGVDIVEAACFQELHGNGEVHQNCLVRASRQYRWLPVAEQLKQNGVLVNFAPHIKTWSEGVVYGRVASDHKGPEALDKEPLQWHKDGNPTPFDEIVPRRWASEGFVRHSRMSSLAFFDVCKEHHIFSQEALWAKATELSEQGDRALLSYLLENNDSTALEKVLKAFRAQEDLRRSKLSRMELLQEALDKTTCSCDTPGFCHGLMKDLARKNGIDGTLQAAVIASLRTGRAKMRNICLVGGADAGKSFLFRGFKEIFKVYERPDGGSYQLESLLGKEVVFLNDFEYDSAAKDWLSWSYLKNFLEGGTITVARPKNRGGNEEYKGTAPVFMTAPQVITLQRYGREVISETQQMNKRICYFHMTYQVPEVERKEVLRHCGHCTAKFYLEDGVGESAAAAGSLPVAAPSSSSSATPASASVAAAAKRPRTAMECVAELRDLKQMLDQGLLTFEEFSGLKTRLLNGE